MIFIRVPILIPNLKHNPIQRMTLWICMKINVVSIWMSQSNPPNSLSQRTSDGQLALALPTQQISRNNQYHLTVFDDVTCFGCNGCQSITVDDSIICPRNMNIPVHARWIYTRTIVHPTYRAINIYLHTFGDEYII
eukprot:206248_1